MSTARADGSGTMFDAIAGRYDLLNRINSLGLDRGWRRRAIQALELKPGMRVLDLATGTADLPLEMAARVPDLKLVGLDPSSGMLAHGRVKVEKAGLEDSIELVEGDAQALAYPDGSFDRITMAFGIRNVPDRLRALQEMRRVLVPGGRVAILELSEPKAGPLGALARFHVHHVVPRIGGLVARSTGGEYAYLADSIAAFPPPEQFAALMAEAGLLVREALPLTFGACVLFVAERP